jgi:hypothetical protein
MRSSGSIRGSPSWLVQVKITALGPSISLLLLAIFVPNLIRIDEKSLDRHRDCIGLAAPLQRGAAV